MMMHIVIPQIPSHRLALTTHTSLGHALKLGPFRFRVTNSHWSCQRTKWTCYSSELGLFKKFKPKFHKMHIYIIYTVHSRESSFLKKKKKQRIHVEEHLPFVNCDT